MANTRLNLSHLSDYCKRPAKDRWGSGDAVAAAVAAQGLGSYALAGFCDWIQVSGNRWGRSAAVAFGRRVSTSLRYGHGLRWCRWQVAMKLIKMAAV